MLVVDTSAVVAALVGRPPDRRLTDRLGTDGDLHVPHLLDVELLHALRRLEGTGQLSEERTGNLTADDATFIALAEALAVPLVTCDARLARAPATGRRWSCSRVPRSSR